MFKSSFANSGNRLSAGGQLEQPSDVNNSSIANDEEVFFFFSLVLPATPAHAIITNVAIMKSHFISASYEVGTYNKAFIGQKNLLLLYANLFDDR